jgi:hypothetical protein
MRHRRIEPESFAVSWRVLALWCLAGVAGWLVILIIAALLGL